MNKEELRKYVDAELQWLKYYSTPDSKKEFDPTKSPYTQLISIGYTKRVIPLHKRCAFLRLTSKKAILETDLEDMIMTDDYCNIENNIYSALEVFIMKFPEEHKWIKNNLL